MSFDVTGNSSAIRKDRFPCCKVYTTRLLFYVGKIVDSSFQRECLGFVSDVQPLCTFYQDMPVVAKEVAS